MAVITVISVVSLIIAVLMRPRVILYHSYISITVMSLTVFFKMFFLLPVVLGRADHSAEGAPPV